MSNTLQEIILNSAIRLNLAQFHTSLSSQINYVLEKDPSTLLFSLNIIIIQFEIRFTKAIAPPPFIKITFVIEKIEKIFLALVHKTYKYKYHQAHVHISISINEQSCKKAQIKSTDGWAGSGSGSIQYNIPSTYLVNAFNFNSIIF